MNVLNAFKSLGQTDFSELDLKNIGSWPLALRVVIGVLVFSAVLLFGYFLRLTDLQAELESKRVDEVALKEQFTIKARQVSQFADYREQMVSIESLFAELLQQLPSETEVPRLLDDINNAGLNSALQLEEINCWKRLYSLFILSYPSRLRLSVVTMI